MLLVGEPIMLPKRLKLCVICRQTSGQFGDRGKLCWLRLQCTWSRDPASTWIGASGAFVRPYTRGIGGTASARQGERCDASSSSHLLLPQLPMHSFCRSPRNRHLLCDRCPHLVLESFKQCFSLSESNREFFPKRLRRVLYIPLVQPR